MLENLDIETTPTPAPQATAARRVTSSRYHRKDVFPIVAHNWFRFLQIELGGILLLEGVIWLLLSRGTLLFSMLPYSQLLSVGLTSGVAIGIIYFTAEKRALHKYIEAVRLEQKRYERTYVALSFTRATPLHEEFNTLEETQLLTQQQAKHLLLIGIPGAGKTIELRVRQYKALEDEQDLLKHRNKVPVFIPMNFYNAFLRDHSNIKVGKVSSQSIESSSLIRYLYKANLPGLHHIRPFLRKWVYRGNLLFLCDGLNEVANSYLPGLCDELIQLMQHHTNHIIMTCREWDFKNQPLFQQLLKHGYVEQETIQPLSNAQIDVFIRTYINSGYVDQQEETWRYQPERVLTLIDKTHFRDECMNPLMLYIFMKIVNNLELTGEDLEAGRIAGIDTRGKLLQRFVEQLLEKRLEDERWKNFPYKTEAIRLFLSHIAYISRRINYRNGLPLGIHRVVTGGAKPKRTQNELTRRLFDLLQEPTSQGYPLVEADMLLSYDFTLEDTGRLREFAESSTIISINEDNSLSFYHELIAEYFAAEYLQRAYAASPAQLPFGVDLIKDIEAWKEPIRIWAGLFSNSLALANRIAQLGKQQPEYGYNALTLGLLCLGVKLTPSTDQPKLPPDLKDLFVEYIKDVEKRQVLADTINRSAYEGGIDVYRAFLPFIIFSPVDQFMLLLEHSKIIPLLFDYLKEIVREHSPTAQLLSRTITTLAQFGPFIISRTIQLSQENPLSGLPSDKQIQLRQAAIEILGKTGLPGAVQPLIALLEDKNEVEIVRKARETLKQLDPALILKDVLQHLTPIQTPFLRREAVQFELLRILQSFLAIDEQGVSVLNFAQYTETIQVIIQLLTSAFTERIRDYAQALLQREVTTNSTRRNYLIEQLIGQLATTDVQFEQRIEVLLNRAGRATTPLLLQRLRQPSTSNSDIMRERIVEVLALVHDPDAIPDLLDLLDTPAPRLRERVGRALLNCRPYCIDPLIEVVLSMERTDTEAAEAAKILVQMSSESVGKLCAALPTVIKGRTILLIQALAEIRDARAILPLIELLNASLSDEALVITLIDALGNFPDQMVVTFLIQLLDRVTAPAYDKTIEVLSRLSEIALDPLIAALRITEESPATQGIRKALAHLHMQPYPNERLLRAAMAANHQQALQLLLVFQARGTNSAPFLISRLCEPGEKERDFVNQTLNQMSKDDILEPLLAALDDSPCRSVIATLLQKYPQDALEPLVRLLSSEKQGLAAANTLIDFQSVINIIPALHPALNTSNKRERGHARYIIVQLVRQSAEILPRVIQMFRLLDLPQDQQAFESLLQVLIGPLATVSTPYLLDALAIDERRIQEGVGEALKRLANRGDNASILVQKGLINALIESDRRAAAAPVIVQIGELMVDRINPLITHTDASISATAHRIMTSIGAGTLPQIYTNLQVQDPRTFEATMKIFRELNAKEIRPRLVKLLASNDPQEVQIAVTLLLLRLREDLSPLSNTDKKMLSELLHYIQRYEQSDEVMRIVAFLLLLPKSIILQQMRNHLYSYPSHSIAWLTPLFLLLGMQESTARDELHATLGNPQISTELNAQIIGILGMLSEDKFAFQHATHLNQLAQTHGSAISSQQAEIARHALGGLLAGNHWNDKRLRQLLQSKPDETYEHELYSILLGESYIPRLQKVRSDLLRAEEQAKQLQGELQRTKQTLQDTQRVLEAKKAELAQSENKYQTHYQLYQQQQIRIAEIEKNNSNLSSKNSEAENINRYLQQQVEQLTLRNLQLQQRIELLQPNSINPHPPRLI